MSEQRSMTAYWTAYECAITGRDKPVTSKYHRDIDQGYSDGKRDLHKQMLAALDEGSTVQ